MQDEDFPGLFQAADELSKVAQSHFYLALFWNLSFLVIAAALSVLNYPHWIAAWLQVLVLLGSLGLSIYLAAKRPERVWYSCRAVAESIKTITWRYVSRAEPFYEPDDVARTMFHKKLESVLAQNTQVADKLIDHIGKPYITPKMIELRAQGLEGRKATYIEHRISNQLNWYSAKAKFNSRRSRNYFKLLIVINVLAIAFSASKIKFVEFQYFPTDVLIALAASILSWMQAKRYSELSASYALTAHEIQIINGQAHELNTDERFSSFIGDAENAFSREHTQWVARKDS